MKLRIGSRGSKLAVYQAEWVGAELKKKIPGIEISFRQITTTGDRDMSANLQAAGGKGVFVKEIEDALMANEIDIAVHSLKDVPQNLPSGLVLGPTPEREDPRDAVISRFGEQLHELPRHSTVGTSSPRRRAQVANLFKKRGYRIEPLRGNVDTRLQKLQSANYDAIILAAAGLKRLKLEAEITHYLNPEVFLPAPTQGCLGLEYRESDVTVRECLETIKNSDATAVANAERAFLQGLGGNCTVPVGVYSSLERREIHMRALLLDESGERAARVEEKGSVDDALLIGFKLAGRLLQEGGAELVQ